MKTRSTKVLVFNGWAAGPETWSLTSFHRDWTFDYLEQLDGQPERVIADFEEVELVGFSMGSETALRLVIDHPEKVRKLVLISATPRMMEEKPDWAGFSSRRLEAFRYGTEMMFRDDPSPIYDVANMNRGLEFLEHTDLRRELEAKSAEFERLGFPVYIFHSERDGIVRPHNALYLKGIFPQAVVTMIPGNEHVLPVTIPEKIDEVMK